MHRPCFGVIGDEPLKAAIPGLNHMNIAGLDQGGVIGVHGCGILTHVQPIAGKGLNGAVAQKGQVIQGCGADHGDIRETGSNEGAKNKGPTRSDPRVSLVGQAISRRRIPCRNA